MENECGVRMHECTLLCGVLTWGDNEEVPKFGKIGLLWQCQVSKRFLFHRSCNWGKLEKEWMELPRSPQCAKLPRNRQDFVGPRSRYDSHDTSAVPGPAAPPHLKTPSTTLIVHRTSRASVPNFSLVLPAEDLIRTLINDQSLQPSIHLSPPRKVFLCVPSSRITQ